MRCRCSGRNLRLRRTRLRRTAISHISSGRRARSGSESRKAFDECRARSYRVVTAARAAVARLSNGLALAFLCRPGLHSLCALAVVHGRDLLVQAADRILARSALRELATVRAWTRA